MDIFAFLQAVIYVISTSLLYPVMIALILLTVWILVLAGEFSAEWLRRLRLRQNVSLADYLSTIKNTGQVPEEVLAHLPQRVRAYIDKLLKLAMERDEFFHEKVENLIQEEELKVVREVDRVRLVVRIGPSLGLMGTLIPMGTGLAALSQGDLSQMTSSLIIAFTTTVVGLALGVTAYVFATAKRRWVQEDVRNMELVTEAINREADQCNT